MGFRLTAKLPLSVTKPNCRRSLTTNVTRRSLVSLLLQSFSLGMYSILSEFTSRLGLSSEQVHHFGNNFVG